jgi:prepilin-type N-terminal cleavage/methylation domain-containing protein
MNKLWTKKDQKGFTIVELLIVIVIIAILAAITIVAYNGIQSRGKTSAAQAAAVNADKKAELYFTETSGYPTAPSQLTGAASTTTYQLTGVTFAASTTSANSPQTLTFISCTATVGVKIGYYDYSAGAVVYVYAGSANSTNCTGTTGLTT